MTLVAAAAIAAFMTLESRGNWDFVLPFRARKVIAMAVVGYAIATSTVIFQTITGNRILTPSIMGFDALYMLIQTLAVFFLGSGRLLRLDPRTRFGFEVGAMILFAGLLFWWLFLRADRGLHVLVLVGIVFGVLFRSVANLLQRVIDPTEFAVLQDLGFASFNAIDQTLLWLTVAIVVAVTVPIWRLHHSLDALVLGREIAVALGVHYRRTVLISLSLVTALVAVSTALVGPITFFGLLAAHLGYLLAGVPYHRYAIPAASLCAIAALIGGQTILELVFEFNTSLSIIIEFLGGVTFLALLLRGGRR
jgi:iron complex transport system permease protein